MVLAPIQHCAIRQQYLKNRLISQKVNVDGDLGAADVDVFVVARGQVVHGLIGVEEE